ncbi:hypothetical protein C8A01DRAFT_36983 [Parachaetomium inaequale]|uniref:Uncharacterized protein n=1 Tax=Parachaetomium inaequale TaxID=2588326 RepID=A0AAN6SR46_9PEZI|nr:hypothetical protein C8A01DRAFT_36983 [Parachaetomium inaequale]
MDTIPNNTEATAQSAALQEWASVLTQREDTPSSPTLENPVDDLLTSITSTPPNAPLSPDLNPSALPTLLETAQTLLPLLTRRAHRLLANQPTFTATRRRQLRFLASLNLDPPLLASRSFRRDEEMMMKQVRRCLWELEDADYTSILSSSLNAQQHKHTPRSLQKYYLTISSLSIKHPPLFIMETKQNPMPANSNPNHIRAEDLDNNPATMTANSPNARRLDVLAEVASRQEYLPVPQTEARHQDLLILAEAAIKVLDKGAADNKNTNTGSTNNTTTNQNHLGDAAEYDEYDDSTIVVRSLPLETATTTPSHMSRSHRKKKNKKGKRNN